MTYAVKQPDGRTSILSLDDIRNEFQAGRLTPDADVLPSDSSGWITIGELLGGAGGSAAPASTGSQSSAATTTNRFSERASNRYRDGYLVARVTDGIGTVVKFVGIALGIITAFAGYALGSQGGSNVMFTIGGVLLGAVIGIPLYVLGVLVSAHAQVLKATIDNAVHTSPFLTDRKRASAMSLE